MPTMISRRRSHAALIACAFLAVVTGALAQTAPSSQPATQGARRGGARGPAAPQSVSPRDALPWTPGDFNSVKPNLPTLIIAGDSTADKGPDAWHRGWAAVLNDYFDTSKINVVNRARGGRSFRTFVKEGLWDQLVEHIKPGDIVMIQFGHNDGGDINAANGRPDIRGDGDQTQEVTRADGSKEVVHTFGWYTRKFINDVKAKGGTPVLMMTTPYNRWTDGKYARGNGVNADLNKKIAEEEKIQIMDHTNIINDKIEKLGEEVAKTFHPADLLHTSTPGAIVNCEAFVAGVKQLDIKVLVDALNEKGAAIPAYKPAAATAN